MSSEKKDFNFKYLVIVFLIVLVVGGLGVTTGYLFFRSSGSKSTEAQTQKLQNPYVSQFTFPLGDDFTVNLADIDRRGFIKTKVFLGYENKKLAAELEGKKPIVRDSINSVLRSKKASDFTEKGVEDIKKEILNKVNPILENGKADNVYFSEIIIQQ